MEDKTNNASGKATTLSIELSNTNDKTEGAVGSIGNESGAKNERGTWGHSIEFLLSCISMSVGLGNVWRFPFTAYENGGGAFLIPYLVVLFLIGKPMYYMEMIMGQFTGKGSVKMWSVCPLFSGIGYGQSFGTWAIITYYSSLIALTLYYLAVSFQKVLPWTYCREEWGIYCLDSLPKPDDLLKNKTTHVLTSSSELYFTEIVTKDKLEITTGLGSPDLHLTISLFIGWLVVYLVISKGVKSSGKASYFLAIFPYVVLVALLVRSVTLEGAMDGILFFLKPQWGELLNLKVWKEAVVQCFFSLAIGFGPIVMFSSYNRFDHNIYRDTMIVTSLDTITSMIAGIAIFGILGNLAYNLNITNINEVVQSGTALAFISYPDAIAKFKYLPQLFAVLFFSMLFILGVGSIVALQIGIVTVICDQYKSFKFGYVALFSCIFGFLLGLMYVTPGGQWILNLVDFYGGTYVIFSLTTFETIGIIWIYGLQNFCDDVEFMTKRKVSLYWRICWSFLTPTMMIIIFIYSVSIMEPLTYKGLPYPDSANAAGWIIFVIGVLQFPMWGLWYINNNYDESLLKSFKNSLRPNENWGPADPEIRAKWHAYKNSLIEQRKWRKSSNKLLFFKQKVYNVSGTKT